MTQPKYPLRVRSGTTSVVPQELVVSSAAITAGSGSADLTVVGTAAANTNNTTAASTAFVQGQGQGYLVYDATLTQTGTSAPTATVGQNNIGQTMTWAYVSPGVYTVTAGAAAFTANKTQVFIGNAGSVNLNFNTYAVVRTSTTVLTINTGEADISGPNWALGNGLLTETAIRIVIFP